MEDRISNLPENVLCHIFSFLPTEDAFATRVLSKKWLPLWLSISCLDFDQIRSSNLLPSSSSFIQFVYATILGRPIHQPIKTLRLKGICSNFHANILLNAIADRKVENLQIHIYPTRQCNNFPFFKLPCTIFSIKTLVVLNLHFALFNAFPFSVHLPSLKSLHLESIRFLYPQYFVNLLNGCPILENLEIEDITFELEDDPSFKRKFKTLSKLVRADVMNVRMFNSNVPVRIFCNAEFLRLDKFCDVDISTFPNLIHMELSSGPDDQWKWKSVFDMLNHCPQLQTFVFENVFWTTLWPDTHVLPECFSSQLGKCVFIDFTGRECEMKFVKFVMQNSTSLRNMKILCKSGLSHEETHEMLVELASYPRSSAACELLFM